MNWRRVREVVVIVIGALLLALLATAKPGDGRLYPAKGGQSVAIFVVDNGFHADIAVPRAAIAAHGGPLAAASDQTSPDPWIMIGWGDAKFYEDASPWQERILDGLAALIGGRPTVVHLQGVDRSPDQAFKGGVHRVLVSPAGLAAMLTRADQSFRLAGNGQPQRVNVARPPGEAYFVSGEGFNAIHICNHWVAGMLEAAGLPMTPVLDTLPAGLALDLSLRSGV